MSVSRRWVISFIMLTHLISPSATLAQSLDTVRSALLSAYQQANTSEVSIKGAIGTLLGETVYFVDETGRYKVKLDAGRDVRRKIESCELNLFDSGGSKCQISGKAEVAVDLNDNNFGDGYEIELILFSVETLDIRN